MTKPTYIVFQPISDDRRALYKIGTASTDRNGTIMLELDRLPTTATIILERHPGFWQRLLRWRP